MAVRERGARGGAGREVAAGQTGDVESQARQLYKEGHGAEAKGGRARGGLGEGGREREISRREGTGFKFSGDEDFHCAAARQTPPPSQSTCGLNGEKRHINLRQLGAKKTQTDGQVRTFPSVYLPENVPFFVIRVFRSFFFICQSTILPL